MRTLNRKMIDDARVSRELSIHGLARESGLTYATCWRFLRGHTNPHVSTIVYICRAVGIDVRDVFCDNSDNSIAEHTEEEESDEDDVS